MTKPNTELWVDKYRPKTINDCVLTQTNKKIFNKYIEEGATQNILLCGAAGTGKTTVARAFVNELKCDSIEINASDDRGISAVRDTVTSFASRAGISGKLKIVILDESDNLTIDAQKALRKVIEDYSASCRFIFTCNHPDKISDALHSRLERFDFGNIHKGSKEYKYVFRSLVTRIASILKEEDVKFGQRALLAFLTEEFPDVRKILTSLQRQSLIGNIDESILGMTLKGSMEELISHLRSKDWGKMRTWVSVHNPDADRFYIEFESLLHEFIKNESRPPVYDMLNTFMVDSKVVASTEINIVAFLTVFMVEFGEELI